MLVGLLCVVLGVLLMIDAGISYPDVVNDCEGLVGGMIFTLGGLIMVGCVGWNGNI